MWDNSVHINFKFGLRAQHALQHLHL